MTTILIASSEPRAGRSTVAAAIAYRIARSGKPVTLARLAGDDSANADAATFGALEYVNSPGKPVAVADVSSLTGDLVIEAPCGSAKALAAALNARVIAVGGSNAKALDVAPDALAGVVVTRAPARELAVIGKRAGVLAILAEDRTLAAPSVADIATALQARWLAGGDETTSAIDRVMIGTVASDAASPYFGQRARTCVITRFDKTDIQLAALLTDLECLVITGGGEPSPYLIDRIGNGRSDVAVLLAPAGTVATMRAIEPLFGLSRFSGAGKLERAVALLDEANVPLEF